MLKTAVKSDHTYRARNSFTWYPKMLLTGSMHNNTDCLIVVTMAKTAADSEYI